MTGTEDFADMVATILTGTVNSAQAVKEVKKALEELSINFNEYKKTENLTELTALIFDKLSEYGAGLEALELEKLMKASDILRHNYVSKDEVVKSLSKQAVGGRIMRPSTDRLVSDYEYESPDLRRYRNTKSVSKQLKDQKKNRETLFGDFKQVLRADYAKVVRALSAISKKMGSKITSSDKVDTFVRRVSELDPPEREDLHIALSGYRRDVNSKVMRQSFIQQITAIIQSLTPLVSGSPADFKDALEAFEDLLKTIETFNKTFLKVLTEVHVQGHESKSESKSGGSDEVMIGGSDELQ
jgi:hypothetical protein